MYVWNHGKQRAGNHLGKGVPIQPIRNDRMSGTQLREIQPTQQLSNPLELSVGCILPSLTPPTCHHFITMSC